MAGPANAGKTYVFTALTKMFVNVATAKNVSTDNRFSFSNLPGKRILFLDEFSFPASVSPISKDLFTGQPFHTPMKYQAEAICPPMPILMCTNEDISDLSDPVWAAWITRFSARVCAIGA